jgi:hypothetical protein
MSHRVSRNNVKFSFLTVSSDLLNLTGKVATLIV